MRGSDLKRSWNDTSVSQCIWNQTESSLQYLLLQCDNAIWLKFFWLVEISSEKIFAVCGYQVWFGQKLQKLDNLRIDMYNKKFMNHCSSSSFVMLNGLLVFTWTVLLCFCSDKFWFFISNYYSKIFDWPIICIWATSPVKPVNSSFVSLSMPVDWNSVEDSSLPLRIIFPLSCSFSSSEDKSLTSDSSGWVRHNSSTNLRWLVLFPHWNFIFCLKLYSK